MSTLVGIDPYSLRGQAAFDWGCALSPWFCSISMNFCNSSLTKAQMMYVFSCKIFKL
ncbi:hypothetical protein REPUB_Repub03eG0204300 [Reevesia pubescens]